ncbi:CRISPR-associated protein [archaeon]|nr:CRISPR-associated protein [archaeon]
MNASDFDPDKVLIFDIKGPMAHFRKYYTNSSSLSYLFPPRTVVFGLIAGLLGLPSEKHTKEKEEVYYEKFSNDKCLVAISVRTKVRRMMQTVNYSATDDFPKTPAKLMLKMIGGEIGHTQIPLEILLPENDNEITYRIYFYYVDEGIHDNLKNRLEKQRFEYPPYLGLSEFLAVVDYIEEGKLSKNLKRDVELNTACKLKDVELDFSGDDLQYLTEKMPTGFLNDRTPQKPEEYVLEVKGEIMRVKLKDDSICYSVNYSENGCRVIENIMFM